MTGGEKNGCISVLCLGRGGSCGEDAEHQKVRGKANLCKAIKTLAFCDNLRMFKVSIVLLSSGMCVTCSCTNCKGNCCGFSSLTSFMCYDAECIFCKFHTVNGNKDKYCTFHASETFCSNTCLRFKCYQQACCFEFFCTLLMDGLNGDPFRPTEKVVFEPTVYSRDGFIRL